MPRRSDEEEFAVVGAPERAVIRHGKGKPMKALLTKKWGTNYAGQVLTNVSKGSIPSDVAEFYEDDEPSPNDVVKEDVSEAEHNPLRVANDEMVDVSRAKEVAKTKAARVAKAAAAPASSAESDEAAEQEDTQRRAREAEQFAAKRVKGARKAAIKKGDAKKRQAGKEHGVK